MLPNSGTSSFLSSRLGLSTSRDASGGGKRVRSERKKVAGREGLVWDSVEVLSERDSVVHTHTCTDMDGVFTVSVLYSRT